MIRRPPRSTLDRSSAASDVYKRQAHLIFDTATKALLEQIETIIKLIRSKGVGIYFCTQDPSDVPESVLGQLGLKVQHSLRAFTAKDRTTIKKTAQNYPITEFYDTEELITCLLYTSDAADEWSSVDLGGRRILKKKNTKKKKNTLTSQ